MATIPAPPPLNPYLVQPVLFYAGVPDETPDEDVVEVLKDCCKLRIFRHESKIEFESLDRAEKAYATCIGQRLPASSSTLSLSLAAPPAADPQPLALPRIIKQLPAGYTASKLFDLARPFGPLASATLLFAPSNGSAPPRFKGQALVTYYDETHAVAAEQGLHFLEVEGQNIAVQVYDARRAARRSDVQGRKSSHTGTDTARISPGNSRWASPSAPAPAKQYPAGLSAAAGEFSPAPSRPMARDFSNSSQASRWSNDGAPSTPPCGASPAGATKRAAAGGIDPCNLFVKSLEPSITTADLSTLFAPFGQIISARVMTDPAAAHRSKEFGFVSFADEAMARAALREMDGTEVRGRRITVRVHEPKQIRAQRLSAGAVGEEDALDQVQQGVASLSTTPSRSPYPSTSPSFSQSPATTPSRRSSAGRALAPLVDSPEAPASPGQSETEHERLAAGVEKLVPDAAKREGVLALIEGLSKKERAMCLFSEEMLKTKVAAALEVLEADDEPEVQASTTEATPSPADAPASLAALAALPAVDIVRLLPSIKSSLALSDPPPDDLATTTAFMDSLEDKPPSEVKQKLGERLFKVVKRVATERGIKGGPRITIALLDSEDLRALATLMHYPQVLAEMVVRVAGAK